MAEQVPKGLRRMGTGASIKRTLKHGFGRSQSVRRPSQGSIQTIATGVSSGQKIKKR